MTSPTSQAEPFTPPFSVLSVTAIDRAVLSYRVTDADRNTIADRLSKEQADWLCARLNSDSPAAGDWAEKAIRALGKGDWLNCILSDANVAAMIALLRAAAPQPPARDKKGPSCPKCGRAMEHTCGMVCVDMCPVCDALGSQPPSGEQQGQHEGDLQAMTDQKRKMKPVKAWLPVDVKTGIASMPPCPTEELAVSSIQLMKLIDDREFRIAVVEIREVEVHK